jgi:hypothetical protein
MNTKPLTYNKLDTFNFPIVGNLFYIFDSELIKGLTIGIKFPCVVRMFIGSNEVVSVKKNNDEVLTIGKDSVIGDYFEIKVNEDKLFFTQYADNLLSRFMSSAVNIFYPSLHNVKCNFYFYFEKRLYSNYNFNVKQNLKTDIIDLFNYSVSNNLNCNIHFESDLSYTERNSIWYILFPNSIWTDENEWYVAKNFIRDFYVFICGYTTIISYNNPKHIWCQWFPGDVWSSKGVW